MIGLFHSPYKWVYCQRKNIETIDIYWILVSDMHTETIRKYIGVCNLI
jgi:hypothetical protein